jgi:Uma2 family endonuclease
MSTAPKYLPHYTVDDYQHWSGEWELWNGVAVAMAPSPFGRHAQLLISVGSVLREAIEAVGCDASVLGEIDWIISRDTILRPDLTVVCGPVPKRHVEEVPALVVEILSPGTRDRDQTFKKEMYQREGVSWYLIVDPDEETLLALKLHDGEYQPMSHSDILTIDICGTCSLSVRVDRLFQ